MNEQIRVLIADDHPIFRDGLSALLRSEGIDVVAEVASGPEAVDAALERSPDVVVMDVRMPGCDGIEATRRLRQSGSEAAVLVLTMFAEDDLVFAAMRAGASGYVLKDALQDQIVRAIRAVASGELIFGAQVARRMLDLFSRGRASGAPAFPQLTPREEEILDLIARGANNAAIARRLVVSEKTVRNHISNIFAKLHVHDRSAAIVKAREAGLGRSPADG